MFIDMAGSLSKERSQIKVSTKVNLSLSPKKVTYEVTNKVTDKVSDEGNLFYNQGK